MADPAPEKDHAGPDAPPAVPLASPEVDPVEPERIDPHRNRPWLRSALWSWPAIGLVIAAGVVSETAQFATSEHWRIVDWLCGVGAVLFCLKFLSSKHVRIRTKLAVRVIVCICVAVLLTVLVTMSHRLKNSPTRVNHDLRIARVLRLPYAGHGQLDYDVYFRYDGENPATVVYRTAAVFFDRKPTSQVGLDFIENFDWESFLKSLQQQQVPQGSEITPKSERYITVHVNLRFEGLTADERLKALTVDRTAMVLLVGIVRWKDATGHYAMEFCTANLDDPDVYLPCKGHNGPMPP